MGISILGTSIIGTDAHQRGSSGGRAAAPANNAAEPGRDKRRRAVSRDRVDLARLKARRESLPELHKPRRCQTLIPTASLLPTTTALLQHPHLSSPVARNGQDCYRYAPLSAPSVAPSHRGALAETKTRKATKAATAKPVKGTRC